LNEIVNLNPNPNCCFTRPYIPIHIQNINRSKRGNNYVYNSLNNNDCTPTGQTHWNKQLNITPEQWKKIYTLPYLITKDTYLLWLQYRILHNILPTNSYLVKIQVCESNNITFCKNNKETIDHLFWLCEVIQLFIEQL